MEVKGRYTPKAIICMWLYVFKATVTLNDTLSFIPFDRHVKATMTP